MIKISDMVSKPIPKAPIITLTGEAGMGKTTLAATFPKPVFIRFEDGMHSIDAGMMPDAFPICTTFDDVRNQLMMLIREEHDYKTVVIDSVSKMDRAFIEEILSKSKGYDESLPESKALALALGGYGAGYQALSAMHGRIRKAAGMLNDKGMTVVFIAHSEVEILELPDSAAHNRFSLRMQKKSIPHYVDDVDLVGQIRLETFLTGEKDKPKKAVSDGTRVLNCAATSSAITKNRYSITDALTVQRGLNPLLNIIPFYNLGA